MCFGGFLNVVFSFADTCNKFIDKVVLGQFFNSLMSLALAMFELTLVCGINLSEQQYIEM